MKEIGGILYSKDHEWVKVEGSKAYVGITDYAQKALGDIVYVELPEIDDEFESGDSFGVVESVKAASDLFLPVSGRIIEINEDLEDSPELVNEDAFKNWLVLVEMSDESQLETLMNGEEYKSFCIKGE